MCRNIKPLFNFEPPSTEAEIRAACEQFVRKVSGTSAAANREPMALAVDEIAAIVERLVLQELETPAPPRTREAEARKAKERWKRREARIAASAREGS